jgi:phytoene dehydrogenase-like protein
MSPDVVIVGGGLAGLACARRLMQCGVSFALLEASDGVGGRVRTDVVDGFRLDRGFQLFLPAYPEAARVLDYGALDLRPFVPGALVRVGGKFHRVADPRVEPFTGLRSAFNPVGTFRDKLRLANLKFALDRVPVERLGDTADVSTLDELRGNRGFTDAFLQRLAVPFFGGVFLEKDLATSARFFRFVFKMFAAGAGVVPRLGMQQIPEQLAANLPVGSVRLNAAVASLQPGRVTLAGGETLTPRAVIVATDATVAARLTGGEVVDPGWHGNVTLYFAADKSPIGEGILAVNGTGTGPVNTVAVLSDVSADYAPPGAALVSVSVVGDGDVSPGDIESSVRRQLGEWYGPGVDDWRHLRTYRIPLALPDQSVGKLSPWQRPVRLRPGLYACGDHRDNASIDGALMSGFRAAQAATGDLTAKAI